MWALIVVFALVVVAAIGGGVGGSLASKHSSKLRCSEYSLMFQMEALYLLPT